MSARNADLLGLSLEFAVPLALAELLAVPAHRRAAVAEEWRAAAVEAVAYRGDDLLFGGKPGSAAAVFTALARGLAVGATAPGGIDFLGRHWEAADAEDTLGETPPGRSTVDVLDPKERV